MVEWQAPQRCPILSVVYMPEFALFTTSLRKLLKTVHVVAALHAVVEQIHGADSCGQGNAAALKLPSCSASVFNCQLFFPIMRKFA